MDLCDSYLQITSVVAYYLLPSYKSPSCSVLFKRCVQKWIVNYSVSWEGDSAVLKAYGKTDWGWIIDESHFCLPVDACQWGVHATDSVSVYFGYISISLV